MNLLRRSRPISAIEAAPLIGVCVGLVLAGAPLFHRVALWAAALPMVAAGARLYLNRRAARMPSLPLKIVLFGLGAVAITLSYGSMVGVEPGLSVLLVLVSLKLLETNSERDFQVLTLLGYFLGLCALFFSQDLLLWLYVGAVFVLLTGTLVRFHRGPGVESLRRSWGLAGLLCLQALPVIVLLFLFVPRTYSGFRFQFSRSLLNSTGLSDRLSPGSISSLALDPTVAFRADFPDRNAPPLSQMYWRGVVLWHGDGLNWEAGPELAIGRRIGQLGGPRIQQKIQLQPHGGRWIVALDRPSGDLPKFDYVAGGCLQSQRLIFNTFYYEVSSRPENHETTLPLEQERAALAPAGVISPRVRALVESWRNGAASEQEIVQRALHHFREEKFTYSLNPGSYGAKAFDEFLFERRVGFCEHYAAAFATLMRVARLPSRVVTGYHGGEYNARLGRHYFIVRQSDSHAWAEVWLRGTGWLRVDPTEVIAPDRISSGFTSYLEARADSLDPAGGGSSAAAVGWREVMREMRLAWDSVNYQWDLRVLNFDEDEQRSFLALIGLDGSWTETLAWAALGIIFALAVIALWLRRPGRLQLGKGEREWARFCGALAEAGVHRAPSEGPAGFGERAAHALPPHAPVIRAVAGLYTNLRYSPRPPRVEDFAAAVRALPRLGGKRAARP